jgi:hypothetical protein
MPENDAFRYVNSYNGILLTDNFGALQHIADFAGNYSAWTLWMDHIDMEMVTTSKKEKPVLAELQKFLEAGKAATGGWTRTNMDDLYGYAIDLAFRSNAPADLQLQTWWEVRVEDALNPEQPTTQGYGSSMEFYTNDLEIDQLITLMETLRVGFLNDRGELLGVAKLFDYNELNPEHYYLNGYERGANARLYLCDYYLDENGCLMIDWMKDDATIMELPQNAPTVVTAVVWMDGDSVDNSVVGELSNQSMTGYMNLQFSSTADLIPSDQFIKTTN